MIITMIGQIAVKIVAVLTGLVIYTKYHACDPLLTKVRQEDIIITFWFAINPKITFSKQVVKQSDQALPYYVMDVAGNIPGLPGLFLAGLVSAALSTMSAALNTVSGSIYEDFVEPWIPESNNKEATAARIMKVTVVIAGCLSGSLVYVVEHMGTVFRMGNSIRSVVDGPMLGLFILGMVVPWVKKKGAMIGGCFSIATMFWLVGFNQWHVAQGRLHHPTLPTSINGCPYPLNETALPPKPHPIDTNDQPAIIFQITFMYFFIIGTIITVVVGIISSIILGEVNLTAINPDHITPCMRKFLPKKKYAEIPLKEQQRDTIVETKGSEAYKNNTDNIIIKSSDW